MNIEPIAYIHTDFPQKFGIPRQSGVIPELTGKIIFCEDFRKPEALRGIETFERLWLIWCFSESVRESWSATVRPPRLGGNERVGVFASRSPFRPNPIGLSCVKLERIDFDTPEGPVLIVSGIDLMNGTPIFDIKPYIPYADSYPNAHAGFTDTTAYRLLEVLLPDNLVSKIPTDKIEALISVLKNDPRPHYQHSPERIYGLSFGGLNIRFRVDDSSGLLTVLDIAQDNTSVK